MPWLQDVDGVGWSYITDSEFQALSPYHLFDEMFLWTEQLPLKTPMPRLTSANHARQLLTLFDDYGQHVSEDHSGCTSADAMGWLGGDSIYVSGAGWRPCLPGPPGYDDYD